MIPELNGRQAVIESEKKFCILATDKHRTGQPIRALTEDGQHLMAESRNFRFVRFATEEEARKWLGRMRLKLRTADFVYTVTDL